MDKLDCRPVTEKPQLKSIRCLTQISNHSYIDMRKVISISANELENEIVFTFENGIKHIEYYENFDALKWLEKLI